MFLIFYLQENKYRTKQEKKQENESRLLRDLRMNTTL